MPRVPKARRAQAARGRGVPQNVGGAPLGGLCRCEPLGALAQRVAALRLAWPPRLAFPPWCALPPIPTQPPPYAWVSAEPLPEGAEEPESAKYVKAPGK